MLHQSYCEYLLMMYCFCSSPCDPDLTPPPAPVQSRHGLEAGFQNATRCRGSGCGSAGKAMLEGYCDKCYVKEQSSRLNQVAHRTPYSPPLVGFCHLIVNYLPVLRLCWILFCAFLIFLFRRYPLPQLPSDIFSLFILSLSS